MEFACPRCETPTSDDFYGPCGTCRTDLAFKYAGLGRSAEADEYEPKMNVTPNAVALKDD